MSSTQIVGLLPTEIIEYLPHRHPFLFVDEVVEVGNLHAVTRYTFRTDEYFYEGHFPNFKVTPGVILLETMCQAAAALGIYLLSLNLPRHEIRLYDTIMTDCELELAKPIFPGDTVVCRVENVLWRHGKLRARVSLSKENGELAALAVIGGMSIKGRA